MGGGKGGGGGGSSTVTQKADPWAPAQPYLQDIMQSAQDWYKSDAGKNYFPDSTSVPLSADTQAALEQIRSRATAGSPVMDAANTNALDTIQGKYLDPASNPYLQKTYDDAAGAANSSVNSAFSSAGRYGSGAHTGVLADKNNQLANQIYGGNYQQERSRQTAMSALAPSLAAGDYNDANALLGAGNIQQQQSANDLQDQINRFNFGQNMPLERLGGYNSLLQGFGGLGGSSSSTQPLYTNTGAGILGGGMTGLSLGQTLGPMLGLSAGSSALGGAGLGALFGALSDARLKTDIKVIGKLASGIPVVTFRYLWSRVKHAGVLAQDVLKIKPDAVYLDSSGYYGVDHARI
jgi:hypothetical protein